MPSVIRYLSTYLSIILLSLTSSGAGAETYNSEAEKAHGNWYSMYLYLGDDRYARAGNTKRNGETLAVDIPIGNCDTYSAELQIRFDTSADETTSTEALGVRARIDRNPVHQLDATIQLERGDRTVFIPFLAHDSARLWRELREGSTIRFEVQMNNGENAYTSFSLDGSAAATSRANAICAQRDPSSYFEDDEGRDRPSKDNDKPDSSYF